MRSYKKQDSPPPAMFGANIRACTHWIRDVTKSERKPWVAYKSEQILVNTWDSLFIQIKLVEVRLNLVSFRQTEHVPLRLVKLQPKGNCQQMTWHYHLIHSNLTLRAENDEKLPKLIPVTSNYQSFHLKQVRLPVSLTTSRTIDPNFVTFSMRRCIDTWIRLSAIGSDLSYKSCDRR